MMKESVYGWYPSARDVYRNAQRYHNNPYQLECLYKYQNSKYYSGQVTPSLQTFSIGLKTPPGHDGNRVPSPPKGQHGPRQSVSRQRQDVDLSQGSPCLVIKPAPRVKATPIPTLSEAWATPTKTDATPITITPAASYPKKVRYKSFHGVPSSSWKHDNEPSVKYMDTWGNLDPSKVNIDWPSLSRDKVAAHQGYRGHRVKSAPVGKGYGVRFAPSRPVHSAKPSARAKLSVLGIDHFERPQTCPVMASKPLVEVPTRNTHSASAILERADRTEMRTELKDTRESRPDNPTPNLADLSLDDHDEFNVSEDDLSSKDEYEDALERYGWRAEVHGDPYGLKKIKPRLSYTVTCEEPVIPPEPPVGHMENWQTFFLNTIPRRPMAYTIHKEWVSEVIHAKRMELQKKEGVNFNFKKYAFAY